MKEKDIVGVYTFYFPKEYIFEEVYKRTSFLSKFRGNEVTPNLLLSGSFTEAEEFMFLPFLEEGFSEVCENVANYTHDLENAFGFLEYSKKANIEIPTGEFVYNDTDENYYKILSSWVNNNSVYGDFGLEFPQKTRELFDWLNSNNINAKIESEATLNYDVQNALGIIETRETRAKICFDIKNVNQNNCVVDGGEIDYSVPYTFVVKHLFDLNVDRNTNNNVPPEVLITEQTNVLKINYIRLVIDDYVIKQNEIIKIGGRYWCALKESTLDDFINNRYGNFRLLLDEEINSLRISVWHKEWFNENALHAVKVSMGESLINYAIYKWLLYTIPAEAEVFLNNFNYNIIKLKDNLNRHKKPIRRGYKWF